MIEIDKYDGISLPEINFVKDDFLTVSFFKFWIKLIVDLVSLEF